MKVFVYGTLRKHGRYHHLLNGSPCLAEQAWTFGELFDTGRGYPVMKSSAQQKVYGEIYEIDNATLLKLDILEDYEEGRDDNEYDRITTDVFTDSGTHKCFVYIENKIGLGKVTIPHGDWKLHHLMETKPSSTYYFAYGSCMDTERFSIANVEHYFENVVGASLLNGYSMKYLFAVEDGGRADIIEVGGTTEGILYEIPYEGVEYLFRREGFYGGWYRPTFVDVTVNNQLFMDVLTFHVYEKQREQAPPAHYAKEILRGSKGRVSTEYFQKLVAELARLGCIVEF
ncbi:gamma-glutamylcyclotransferase [Robertmurraya kyonggiensis]|uniref:Gamma-glutamylcyclotransferase n=1 Tax=Robertmurraya kyonggiensis TaxID=1037680 RepID=A0A4U1DD64_9BACI|nr:gamma-glutamylcyclotransferase family protein [Robertmurraya kyonggiensis]TKC19376.1 gamma-glutamylcyclotransferase [Robertmurraya kyonggiensis]